MRVTSKQVAERAGVSRSAVSRAFTPGAPIAEDRRRHILEVADGLGYRPNLLARGLKAASTGLIGIVMGQISSPFEAHFLTHLDHATRAAGLWPLLVTMDGQSDEAAQKILSYQVDGMIVAGGSISAELAAICAGTDTPLVMIGREIAGHDAVLCDNAAGVAKGVAHLLAAGRRRLAWLGGPEGGPSERARRAGFRAAVDAAGASPVALLSGDYTTESGLVQGLRLLTEAQRPDAVMCGNDAMAIGLLSAAARLGLRVPEDLAVIGFDDIPMAALDQIALTTIATPVAAMAGGALSLLLDPAPAPRRQLHAPALVTRATA